jgi:hypothetical protein
LDFFSPTGEEIVANQLHLLLLQTFAELSLLVQGENVFCTALRTEIRYGMNESGVACTGAWHTNGARGQQERHWIFRGKYLKGCIAGVSESGYHSECL